MTRTHSALASLLAALVLAACGGGSDGGAGSGSDPAPEAAGSSTPGGGSTPEGTPEAAGTMNGQELVEYLSGTGMTCNEAQGAGGYAWTCAIASGAQSYKAEVTAKSDYSITKVDASAIEKQGAEIDPEAVQFFANLVTATVEPAAAEKDIGREDAVEWLSDNIASWATILVSDQGRLQLNHQDPVEGRRFLKIRLGGKAAKFGSDY